MSENRESWMQGSAEVDRTAKEIAAAYGCGASWSANLMSFKFDEVDTWETTFLTVNDRGNVVNDAKSLLPKQKSARNKELKMYSKSDRKIVEDFDRKIKMNTSGKVDKVRRLHQWSNKKYGGFALVPTTKPPKDVLAAISECRLMGPIEDWLLFYCAEQTERWADIESFFVSAGYDASVCRYAASRMLGAGLSYKDAAKKEGVRVDRYTRQIKDVERILWGWLEKASGLFLRRLAIHEVGHEYS